MTAGTLRPLTLRRSCQACARGKRRCDQRWPRCTRCEARGANCEYVNEPLTVLSGVQKAPRKRVSPANHTTGSPSPIRLPLQLEIAKEYDRSAIRFLVNGLRALPNTFAETCKTTFVHPDLYASGLPASIRDMQVICKSHLQAEQQQRTSVLLPLLHQRSGELHRRFNQSLTFEELLGCSQALLLAQCILALNGGGDPNQYSERISVMLDGIAMRLWEQAPVQLPSTFSRRRAWLMAESVRRTIIVSLMLKTAYSLNTRNCGARTPFVDALPFDVRTQLWEDDSDYTWATEAPESPDSMISLHGYSDALESGQFRNISSFGALVLAACKGKEVSSIPFPPPMPYYES
ncbi:uncharacterized protein N7484_006591 [Penicillium longicatenatum]|uniref:uncharacterized protein n=1 Tax=Penicillium longicatenatum TaxID=1561947 RepID=UPI0025490315|nr:uncharacterized protein N7484_006591 [Penicillium longicatenatum]KAJ5644084.1 hypothetical protein N7484_006591 [Penicillium longicatenatum]